MIEYSTEGSIAQIAFNNPPHGYLNAPDVAQLACILTEVEADDRIRVIVASGALPGVFIRHYDVNEEEAFGVRLKQSSRSDEDIAERVRVGNPTTDMFRLIETSSRPVIAAINGFCQGGGLELALSCDLRIAQRGDYFIGLPEVHLGINPGGGGTIRLRQVVGQARALDLILRGRSVSPEEALGYGMVHELADDAQARALEIAAELARIPRGAIAACKALVRGSAPDETLYGDEQAAMALLLRNDPDAMVRVRSFLAHGGYINDWVKTL